MDIIVCGMCSVSLVIQFRRCIEMFFHHVKLAIAVSVHLMLLCCINIYIAVFRFSVKHLMFLPIMPMYFVTFIFTLLLSVFQYTWCSCLSCLDVYCYIYIYIAVLFSVFQYTWCSCQSHLTLVQTMSHISTALVFR